MLIIYDARNLIHKIFEKKTYEKGGKPMIVGIFEKLRIF